MASRPRWGVALDTAGWGHPRLDAAVGVAPPSLALTLWQATRLRRTARRPRRRRADRMILACGYFTVNTVFLKRLYVLFFLELASRRIVFTACSEHPGGGWAVQQARNLAWELQEAEIRPAS